MVKYINGQDIASDNDSSIKKARAKHLLNTKRADIAKPYRIYNINNNTYTAKGYWQEDGKLYKDRICFSSYTKYQTAKKIALNILNTTTELAISIEDIKKSILYIIYKDKTLVLRVKYSKRTANKKDAIRYIKEYTALNGGATLELKGGLYNISSYK